MQQKTKIEELTKEEILKMTRACLQNKDVSLAKQFLNLCYEKRQEMRNKVEEIQFLLIDKDSSTKAIKYIDILLKK